MVGGGTLLGGWFAESLAVLLSARDPDSVARVGRVLGGLVGLFVFAWILGGYPQRAMKPSVWIGGCIVASVLAFLIGSSGWPFLAILVAGLVLTAGVTAICLTLLILIDRSQHRQRDGTPVEL
jgi:hypothetical protein